MSYSAEMESFTTWFMVGGGIILLFSFAACNGYFSGKRETGLAKTIDLVGFWNSFYGTYLDHRLSAFW
jgi:hypothetical protein